MKYFDMISCSFSFTFGSRVITTEALNWKKQFDLKNMFDGEEAVTSIIELNILSCCNQFYLFKGRLHVQS